VTRRGRRWKKKKRNQKDSRKYLEEKSAIRNISYSTYTDSKLQQATAAKATTKATTKATLVAIQST